MRSKNIPPINSGPIADISFLLLVFFLVATTMNADKGVQRKLPRFETAPPFEHHKRNTLSVKINSSDEILCNESYTKKNELRKLVKDFIINDGQNKCEYCVGSKHHENSSDSPEQAWVSLEVNRSTSYDIYVFVQGEITGAYNELRNELSHRLYKKAFKDANDDEKAIIKDIFPIHLSESEVNF